MKVFIADDEVTVRQGLKKIINWEELEFEICGEAGNGNDCLEGLIKLQPDLLLLDIHMPKMHGLEVVKLAKEQGFKGKIIIISGYSDFQYAQSAIRYGVDYYLLKPIDEDELEEAVVHIRNTIEKDKLHKENEKQYISKAKYAVLRDIIQGKESDNKVTSTKNEPDFEIMNLNADCYQVVIIENYDNTELSDCQKFLKLLKLHIGGSDKVEYLQIHKRNVILLKGNEIMKRFVELVRVMQDDANSFEKENIFIVAGRSVPKLDTIPLSYNDAKQLSDRKFFCKKQQFIVTKEDIVENNILIISDESEGQIYFELLYKCIETYNRTGIKDTLLKMKNEIVHSGNDEELTKNFLAGIFIRIKHNVMNDYSKWDIPFQSNAEIIDYIQNSGYLYEIMDYFEEQLFNIIKEIGNSSSESILSDILHYIDQNYRKNLKLETIAVVFGYNSAYLGKVFTKNMGENFNSYVDKVRINYAKELLLQDKLKVYEIAENVGYKNLDYFHKKFKKYVGYSPAEYRKQIEKDF